MGRPCICFAVKSSQEGMQHLVPFVEKAQDWWGGHST